MITHFRFQGHDICIDVGMMRIMGEATGMDAVNPLEGITDTFTRAEYILYAGKAREDVKAGRAIQTSLKEVKEILNAFSLPAVLSLIRTFESVLMVAVEQTGAALEEAQEPVTEKKT